MPLHLKPGPESLINQGFFRLSSGHVTPAFSLVPFASTVCLTLANGPASLRAIRLTCDRDKGRTTDRANLSSRVITHQRGFQRKIKRKDGVLEILAVRARPPFVQHVAGTIQRQAAVFRVVVGAHARHQLADSRPFAPGQFAGFRLHSLHSFHFGPTWPEVASLRERSNSRQQTPTQGAPFQHPQPRQGEPTGGLRTVSQPGRGTCFIIRSNGLSVKFMLHRPRCRRPPRAAVRRPVPRPPYPQNRSRCRNQNRPRFRFPDASDGKS